MDYYEHPALSHSRLKEIRKSPGHFLWSLENPYPSTDAMNLGSLVHAMVLEPHTVEDSFVEIPKIDRRTKEGKEQYALFQQKAMDKVVVPDSDWKVATLMCESVRSHPIASKVIDDAIAYGQVEREYFWTDDNYGDPIERKAKVDGLCRDSHCGLDAPIVDLKTTVDASPFSFKRAITKYSYGTQMSYYKEAVGSTGVGSSGALIIAVEKKPPYAVGVYRLSEETLFRAGTIVKQWLSTYSECLRTGVWKTYWDLQEVDIPDWFLTENGVEV